MNWQEDGERRARMLGRVLILFTLVVVIVCAAVVL